MSKCIYCGCQLSPRVLEIHAQQCKKLHEKLSNEKTSNEVKEVEEVEKVKEVEEVEKVTKTDIKVTKEPKKVTNNKKK